MTERLNIAKSSGEVLDEGGAKRDLFGKLHEFKDSQERLIWNGTFAEYVDMVTINPDIARSSHKTVYDAIASRPDFFDTGENALYGADESIERFMKILEAGSQGHAIGKRIILLLGPPGSGKSTLVNGAKRGIEAYSKTDEGAMYGIKDCPMHEEPLHLIPLDMRPMLEEEYGIHIEGDLCPVCDAKYGNNQLGSEAMRDIEISRFVLSEKNRLGIGTFKPSDPKSQDITELVGSPDYSKIGEVGTAADARAYSFDGELHIANRGVMEFVEMLKSDERFLYVLLDLAQDRVIKSPRYPNVSADEVILAHTNLAEYERYMKDPRNEAIRDRVVTIDVPYTLQVSQERKIHEKLIAQSEKVKVSGVHVNPLSLDTAATFAVLSRLKESPKCPSKIQKMALYDGKDVGSMTQRDVKELKKEHRNEGMSGISPRYIIDSLSLALGDSKDKKCLTPIDTIRSLKANLDFHPHTRDMQVDDKKALLKDLEAVQEEYDKAAKKEIQSAFVYSYEDTARSLSENYFSNIEAFCSNSKMIDPMTEEEIEPDEGLMRSIEEQIGVSVAGKKEFRTELLMRMLSSYRTQQKFDYKDHPRLKEAIENKLFADMRDVVKLTTSSKIPNEDQQERIKSVERTLIEDRGYCPHCASELIRYVGTLLSRA